MVFALAFSKKKKKWSLEYRFVCSRFDLEGDSEEGQTGKGSDTGQLGPSPTRVLLQELWRMFCKPGAPEGRNIHDSWPFLVGWMVILLFFAGVRMDQDCAGHSKASTVLISVLSTLLVEAE